MKTLLRKINLTILFLALLLMALGCLPTAQSNPLSVPQPTPTRLSPDEMNALQIAEDYLRAHAKENSLQPDLSDLVLLHVTLSPGSDVVDFQQLYQGIPVYGGAINVVVPHDNKQAIRVTGSYNPHIVIHGATSLYPGPSGGAPTLTPKLSVSDALSKGLAALNVKGQLIKSASPELVLYPIGRVGVYMQYALAWYMMLYPFNPPGDWEVVIDADTGETLKKWNLNPSDCLSPLCTPSAPAPPNPTPTVNPTTPTPTSMVPTAVPQIVTGPSFKSPQIDTTPTINSAPSWEPIIPPSTTIAVTSTVVVSPTHTPRATSKSVSPLTPQVAPPVQLPFRTNTNSPRILAPSTPLSGWTTIMTEGFEGVWPNGSWSALGDPTWGDTSYIAHSGSWSGWCAKGGSQGLEPYTQNYANNMNAWAVFGPFDLSDAAAADLSFWYWNKSEAGYDFFQWLASVDSSNFYGYQVSGDSLGWNQLGFDLTNVPILGNITERSDVWIAFRFTSDSWITDKGTFIDDLLLEKYVPPPPANLRPYTPAGWDYPLVPSSVQGTHALNTLYANQPTYIDWAVINDGGTTAYNFYVTVYFDNSPIQTWYVSSLDPGTYAPVTDWPLSVTSSGWHTLQIVADSTNVVVESNEGDNSWQSSFFWNAPNLTPYTPAGWDFPIVPSWVQGTHSVGSLYSNMSTYIDWALINNGTATAYNFDIKLYRDNVEISSWHITQLDPGYYLYVNDWVMSAVPLIGNHTLKLVADPSNTVIETNEGDNAWEHSFTWSSLSLVFNPNPVVTSRDMTLRDNNNQDIITLTSQLKPITLQGLDGTGYLRGPHADLTAPGMWNPGRCDANQPNGSGKPAGQALEPTLIYQYTRSDDRFEEVMAYYHIDSMQRYIQSLGFTNVANRSIPVHAHCYSAGASLYSTGDNGIGFSDTGVDAAEDAEIIAHEYGHAIQFSQVPNWGATHEGQAMREGFGIYWAASF